jgi:hypothetical protein
MLYCFMTYILYRGSHNGNQDSVRGIYGTGVHYSTRPETAAEFGEVYAFCVQINNPLFLIKGDEKINQEYDAIFIPIEREESYFDNGEERTRKFIEVEVICFHAGIPANDVDYKVEEEIVNEYGMITIPVEVPKIMANKTRGMMGEL